jgi:hypothetical protein
LTREPSSEQLAHALGRARAAVANPESSAQHLRTYYSPTGNYAGSTFLDLAPNPATDVTSTDLYALSLLDVRAGPRAARRLLQDNTYRAAVIHALMNPALDEEVDLLTADEEAFAAAEVLYLAVRAALGRRPWVTASKLCARKRSRFFPVRDSVVTQHLLQLGNDYLTDWLVYRHLLADSQVRSGLEAAVGLAANGEKAVVVADPLLRVLDVLLWMTAPPEMRPRRRGRTSA